MTTEIKKEFFKAFGIPKNRYGFTPFGIKTCAKERMTYPQITDRILLQLIVICLNNDFVVHSKNLNELQEKILYLLTQNANNKDILYAVRKLFEVEEQ